MQKWLYRFLIELTNHRFISYALKRFSQSRVSAILIPSYTKIYKINENEMEKSLEEMKTLHDLFIRQLKKDKRKIDQSMNSIISPVDAVVEEIGTITSSKQIVVKDKRYSIEEMLGDDRVLQKYINGTFVILYLSPSHYHRIHSPISGEIVTQWELGKKSYPVNKYGLRYGRSPLTKNFRRITEIQGGDIHIAVVKVGAMFVNSIEVTHKHEHIEKGEELAYFSFGSTVILLFEENTIRINEKIKPSTEIRVGDALAYTTN